MLIVNGLEFEKIGQSKPAVQKIFMDLANKFNYDIEFVHDNGLYCDGDDWRSAALKIETQGPNWVKHSVDYLSRIKDANIVVVGFSAIGQQLLNAAENLELVAAMRSGVENIDLASCEKKGVAVCCAPGRVSEPVADFACALILDCNRGITYVNKEWKPGLEEELQPYFHPELFRDLTIGLIGFGIIGKKVVKRLQNFGFKFIAFDPFVKQEDADSYGVKMLPLNEVMAKADTISIHARLLPETKNLIGSKQIALMKSTAFIVNTARGGLIDEEALIEALKHRRIRGAALDVLQTEPLPDNHVLRSLDNVILTPHLAGMAGDMDVVSAQIIAGYIEDYLEGKPVASRKV